MSPPATADQQGASSSSLDLSGQQTVAPFSPASSSPAARSSFQVHQKSPLLVATPPQVTRALSRAYPWIEKLDYVFRLLTWTTGDPWESFLVVAAFWGTTLYGDVLLRYLGSILTVVLLIAAMYLRRYWRRDDAVTMEDILSTLTSLNERIEVFFSPAKELLELLSSQKNATTATTRPKLTTLFIRILLLTPLWLALSIWPFHIITPRRIVISTGTLVLSWHSRPAKVSRTILWRSTTLRILAEKATGLSLSPKTLPPLPPRHPSEEKLAATASSSAEPATSVATAAPGVKFTFAIYENQRRWLGVGWTATLFAYERAAWTDEHLSPCPPPDEFVLPSTPAGSNVHWRWVAGEDWEVEGATGGGNGGTKQVLKDKLGGSGEAGEGWWYYDNKWRDGRRGVDGWGKYTRRRKWVRRAELVEGEAEVVKEKPPLPPRESRESTDAGEQAEWEWSGDNGQ